MVVLVDVEDNNIGSGGGLKRGTVGRLTVTGFRSRFGVRIVA